MQKEKIQAIIEAGNLAPSGSNSQPWKFAVRGNGNKIDVIGLPERDHAVMNFRNRGTYVAHGALIENMEIAARQQGFAPHVTVFPGGNVFASFELRPAEKVVTHNLASAISHRHTNRRPFKTTPIGEHDKKYLFEEAQRFPSCELSIVEGELQPVAENLAFDILVTFQNELLHRLLFEEILWEEEHQKTRKGLYVRTMEVKPPKSSIFKLLRKWKTAQFLSKLKIPKKIYEENAKTISSAGLIGVIAVKDNDQDFIEAGKMVENIWLRAAKLGLGFQLITGVLFLWQQANLGNAAHFSALDREIIDRAYDRLRESFKTTNGILAVAFRIGHSGPPTAVSHKRPPEIQWE